MSYESRIMSGSGSIDLIAREADEGIKDLEDALRPFARFHCSPKGECECHNCRARDLLEEAEQES